MRLPIHNELGEILHLGDVVGQPTGVTVVFDGQAGSEGKGAIAGWLAHRNRWAIAASTFMPNAGHTYVDDGREVVVTQIPIALVSPTVDSLALGASSVINFEQFMIEVDKYDSKYDTRRRLAIHPRALVMRPEYIEWEQENLKYIASTGKGCGAAIAAKARREQTVMLAKDHPILREWVRSDFDTWINDIINAGGPVLAEQSQGFDLDIHRGTEYPFCTSRQTTPSQICADLGVEGRLITNSIAVVRTFPIKVGNAEGHSGEYGSEEINWNSVSARAGREVEERTTVTDRVRRVFEFDWARIGDMSEICRPTQIALTFADYIDPTIHGLTQQMYSEQFLHSMIQCSKPLHNFVYKLEGAVSRRTFNPKVRIVKTGPDNNHTLSIGLSL